LTQNLSIQAVPINTTEAYSQIDLAIEVIKNELFSSGTEELLLNLQFHAKNGKDVFLNEKIKVY